MPTDTPAAGLPAADALAQWLLGALLWSAPHSLGALASALGFSALALLCALYLGYERILARFAQLLHAAFAGGLALAASALLLEPAYRALGCGALARSGIPAQLRAGDAFVRDVETLPERMYERVRHPFSDGPAPGPPALLPPGPLERAILPGLEQALGALLRALAFWIGLTLMCVALLARPSADLILRSRALRRRVDALEAGRAQR